MFAKEPPKNVKTPRVAPEIWHNGQFIPWDEARVHVMSHVLHYGSSVFEGIRCYSTTRGSAIFRLREHMQRLRNSAKVYRMDHEWTLDALCDAAVEIVRRSGLEQCYLRPIIFRGFGSFGVNPFPNPLECYIAAWDWGKYLGDEALEQGVDVCVSSWNRITPNSMPAMAKAGANYMNAQLIKMEALVNGFAEGIALDDRGLVSEGSGENLFLVQGDRIFTPPLSSSILPGITRDSIFQICRELGLSVVEAEIQRAALYIADELFFTGTAAEVTPIRSVDRIIVGEGRRGPVTTRLQQAFFDITSGRRPAPGDWLTYVNPPEASPSNTDGAPAQKVSAQPKEAEEPIATYSAVAPD